MSGCRRCHHCPTATVLFFVHISGFTLNLNTKYVKRNIIKLRRTKRTHRKQQQQKKQIQKEEKNTDEKSLNSATAAEKNSIRLKILALTTSRKKKRKKCKIRKTHLLSSTPLQKENESFFQTPQQTKRVHQMKPEAKKNTKPKKRLSHTYLQHKRNGKNRPKQKNKNKQSELNVFGWCIPNVNWGGLKW